MMTIIDYMKNFISDCIRQNVNFRTRVVILADGKGQCSIVLHEEMMKRAS